MNDPQTAIQTAILTSLDYRLIDGVWERAEGPYLMRVELGKRFVSKSHQVQDRQIALSNYFDLESFIIALGRVTDAF